MRRALAAAVCLACVAWPARAEIKVKILPDGSKMLYNEPSRQRNASRSAVPAVLPGETTYQELADQSAARHELDPLLVSAVIGVESAWNAEAVSIKGAIGLMQLMPETAKILQVDPWDPEGNVDGGSRYLRSLLDRFDGDLELALAGYNAGPLAVERYGGVPPYPETVAYVERVLGRYFGRDVYTVEAASAPLRGRSVHMSRDGNGRLVLTTSSGY
jgi:soluble lytic murein transglycosylase-like protein